MATEKHLIYKEDLLDSVLDHFGCDLAYLGEDLQFCQEAIDMAPAVDAVEVVRCKDCKHWRNSGNNIFGSDYGTCVECLMDTQQEHFCSYGERREGE